MCSGLSNEVVHDFAVHVGEAEVTASGTKREFLVVEAEKVEHGGVEVVDVDGVHLGFEAEFVCRAVDVAGADAAACEPCGEAVGVVVAAVDLAGVEAGSR